MAYLPHRDGRRLGSHDGGFGFGLLPALSPAEDDKIRPHGSRSRCYGSSRRLADGLTDARVIPCDCRLRA